MSQVFGPMDGSSQVGRFSGYVASRSLLFTNWLMNVVDSDVTTRFDPNTYRLSVHGESQHSGNAFDRGQAVAYFACFNMLLVLPVLVPLSALTLVLPGGTALFGVIGMLAIGVAGLLNMVGTAAIASKIEVVDHTTAAQPDALDGLQKAYVDGDLTEQELEEQVEQVIDR